VISGLKKIIKGVVLKSFKTYPAFVVEDLLDRRIGVIVAGKKCFTLHDFGIITRSRAKSIETKEPETIAWLNNFPQGSVLLDVGANVGVFSLYAASLGIRVIALEPQALNFACLHLNCVENGFQELIDIYPVCAGNKLCLSYLNMFGGSTWGTANSTFDRPIDSHGRERDDFNIRQGSVGIKLDSIVELTQVFPTHLKIDVDGNEQLVLEGARATLSDHRLRSILIELCTDHSEYGSSVELIESFGFKLIQEGVPRKNTYNHIFIR
tara:strand:- start:8330 stop:9127 length:798 start_codon:yes stop_codon:yes gene_type:complete